MALYTFWCLCELNRSTSNSIDQGGTLAMCHMQWCILRPCMSMYPSSIPHPLITRHTKLLSGQHSGNGGLNTFAPKNLSSPVIDRHGARWISQAPSSRHLHTFRMDPFFGLLRAQLCWLDAYFINFCVREMLQLPLINKAYIEPTKIQ
jgi:hypothetical protein